MIVNTTKVSKNINKKNAGTNTIKKLSNPKPMTAKIALKIFFAFFFSLTLSIANEAFNSLAIILGFPKCFAISSSDLPSFLPLTKCVSYSL